MIISFSDVSKSFGSINALSDVSFKIESGEFVFLTGPSGSGKTTIIRLLLREYLPTKGTIEVGNWNLGKIREKEVPKFRQKIGVVFQDFKLLADRTIFENIALGLDVQGKLGPESDQKITEVLDLTGLTPRANLFPAQLAGGELQRTCLARAVVTHPQILLADEPTGNLDVTTSWQIIKLIRKINKMGTTVLMVTHNVDIVNSFRDRVLLLKGGKLIKDQKSGRYEF